ncbi:hypothetical protein [Candidatus Ichthyocystis sparus]|nr:hypothetical protein [Candidatus Ichthyocystis sparus]
MSAYKKNELGPRIHSFFVVARCGLLILFLVVQSVGCLILDCDYNSDK